MTKFNIYNFIIYQGVSISTSIVERQSLLKSSGDVEIHYDDYTIISLTKV